MDVYGNQLPRYNPKRKTQQVITEFNVFDILLFLTLSYTQTTVIFMPLSDITCDVLVISSYARESLTYKQIDS